MENETLPGYSKLPRGLGSNPGVYVIEHVKSGAVYIGSTSKMGVRKSNHEHSLRENEHRNPLLQQAFNTDPEIEFTFIPTKTREEALEYEQKLLDNCKASGGVLNIAGDVKSSGKGVIRSEETKKKVGLSGIGRVPFNKGQSLSDSHLAAVVESRKALSKQVSVDSVVYPSLAEAARQLNLTIGCLAKRVTTHTEQFKNYFYI